MCIVFFNRIEFSLSVKAYLLPEKFDGESPIKKSLSTKRVVIATETDVTSNGRLEGMLTTPSPYYDNKDLIDFLSLLCLNYFSYFFSYSLFNKHNTFLVIFLSFFFFIKLLNRISSFFHFEISFTIRSTEYSFFIWR